MAERGLSDMGREIRRVPVGWQHPKDERGYLQPLHDETIEQAQARWDTEAAAHPASDVAAKYSVEDWIGKRPSDPTYYRPDFGDAELGWCMYETVTEGTPVGPVFSEPEAMHRWLVEEKGYPADAAARFMVAGWAPTFVGIGADLVDGVTAS